MLNGLYSSPLAIFHLQLYVHGMVHLCVALGIKWTKDLAIATSVHLDTRGWTVLTDVTIQPTETTVSWGVIVLLICVTLCLDVRIPVQQVHICHRSRIGNWSQKNWKQASLTRPWRPEVCQRNRQILALLLPLLSLCSTQPLLSYLYLYFFLSSTFFLICGKCLSPDKKGKLLTPNLQIRVTPFMNVLSFHIICKKNYQL